jgi:hypothetical protein
MGYPPHITQKHLAPRPAGLRGKTVYLIDCRFDDGDILVEQMANWFGDNRPDVNIEVRRKSGVYTERDEALYTEIQQKGAAAIVAVGH